MDRKVYVVYDRNVERYALNLAGGRPAYPLDADESRKSLETVTDICRWLASMDADRNAVLIAVGGGFTSDVAGFAASIYKRGIDCANVPTTLLAMVDAGIGGKTGANLDGVKNVLGTFHQPIYTRIDTNALKTLPRRQMLSGAAEMLKTFIIGSRRAYLRAVRLFSAYNAGGEMDWAELEKLVFKAIRIKARIVRRDPLERGKAGRRVLNLGHSWAHAVEWWQATSGAGTENRCHLTHGEAVAAGIIRAAEMSASLGLDRGRCPFRRKVEPLADTLRRDFASCGLPTELPCPEDALKTAFRADKKAASDGSIALVLPIRIGRVRIETVPINHIK